MDEDIYNFMYVFIIISNILSHVGSFVGGNGPDWGIFIYGPQQMNTADIGDPLTIYLTPPCG